MYQLKKGQESFTPVEGPYAGRKYVPGRLYEEIPPEEEKRFVKIKPADRPAAGKRGQTAESPESGEVKK